MRINWMILVSIFVLIGLPACRTFEKFERSDRLWQIVSRSCIPNQLEKNDPSPCEKVVLTPRPEDGFVVLKDRVGPLQYLLMPTAKITGVESRALLAPEAPNYFYLAWLSRIYMAEKRGLPVDDRAVSLAVNSRFGRSQNQLHVHISCVRTDVRLYIDEHETEFTERWSPLPEQILGRNAFVRFLSEAEFRAKSPFLIVKEELLAANEPLDAYGIAIVPVSGNGNVNFALFAERADLAAGDRGSAEEIQEHACSILK